MKGWGLRGENKGFRLLTTSVSLVMVFSLVVMKYPKYCRPAAALSLLVVLVSRKVQFSHSNCIN